MKTRGAQSSVATMQSCTAADQHEHGSVASCWNKLALRRWQRVLWHHAVFSDWIRIIIPSHGLLWWFNCIYKSNSGGHEGTQTSRLSSNFVFLIFCLKRHTSIWLLHCQLFSSSEVHEGEQKGNWAGDPGPFEFIPSVKNNMLQPWRCWRLMWCRYFLLCPIFVFSN